MVWWERGGHTHTDNEHTNNTPHPTPSTHRHPIPSLPQDCIQELMQCAVTCASPALYASLRLFLQVGVWVCMLVMDV